MIERCKMNVNRALRAIAGFLVFLSAVMAHFHSPYWLFFTGFIGINLFQSAFTNWCPMMNILRALGIKD